MQMAKQIYYDGKNDILSVHKGFSSDEKFKGNIDAGKLILDVSTRGRIKGIEVMDATKFFREFKIGRKILENITDADFTASIKPSSIILGIVLKAKHIKDKIPAKIAVPLEVPVC